MKAKAAKILVVDDDRAVRALFTSVLVNAGYEVAESGDGMDALERVQREKPDLILLDVDMPRLNGRKTLVELRRRGCAQPVLMITHLNDVDARVGGLEDGADDYLGKPCVPAELLARVRALLRRAGGRVGGRMKFGDLVIDLERKTAMRDGKAVRFTRTEFALLELLRRHAGKPVSRQLMIEHIWGTRTMETHTIDTHLWRLRRKLGDVGGEARWLRNAPGIGYVLAAEATSESA